MKKGYDAPAGGSAQVAGLERVKISAGETWFVTVLDEPLHMMIHPFDQETNTNSAVCSKAELGSCKVCEDPRAPAKHRKLQFQFAAPVYVHGYRASGSRDTNQLGEVRVLEGGRTILKGLETLIEDFPPEKSVYKISREGSGLMDTKYTVSPTTQAAKIPKGTVVPDLESFYTEQMEQSRVADPKASYGKDSDIKDPDEETPDPFAGE